MEHPNDASGKSGLILDAADRVFARFGYKRTVMEDVAKEAGVAKGTLYLYFESKESLFRAIVARNIAAVEALCEAAEARGGPLEEQLYHQLNAWFGTSLERYGAYDHLWELSTLRKSIGSDLADTADRAYTARLTRILQAAQGRGEADLSRLQLTAQQLVAVLLSAARGSKYAGEKTRPLKDYRLSLRHIARLVASAITRKERPVPAHKAGSPA